MLPKAGVGVAPKAGVEETPNAGVDVAPNADVPPNPPNPPVPPKLGVAVAPKAPPVLTPKAGAVDGAPKAGCSSTRVISLEDKAGVSSNKGLKPAGFSRTINIG